MTEQTPSLEHPQVRKNAERYEIVVDDAGTVAGYTVAIDYDSGDGPVQRIFPHTKVDHEYEGRGLASTLVREALKDTVAAGRRSVDHQRRGPESWVMGSPASAAFGQSSLITTSSRSRPGSAASREAATEAR